MAVDLVVVYFSLVLHPVEAQIALYSARATSYRYSLSQPGTQEWFLQQFLNLVRVNNKNATKVSGTEPGHG